VGLHTAVELPWRQTDNLPPSISEGRKRGSYNSIPPYALLAWWDNSVFVVIIVILIIIIDTVIIAVETVEPDSQESKVSYSRTTQALVPSV
jgi:hypothetical protein